MHSNADLCNSIKDRLSCNLKVDARDLQISLKSGRMFCRLSPHSKASEDREFDQNLLKISSPSGKVVSTTLGSLHGRIGETVTAF